jgi:hypothetical protein
MQQVCILGLSNDGDRGTQPSQVAVVRDAQPYLGKLDMSDHSGIVYSTAEGMDYPAHEKSYKSFVKLGTILASTAATVIALMAIFLT